MAKANLNNKIENFMTNPTAASKYYITQRPWIDADYINFSNLDLN